MERNSANTCLADRRVLDVKDLEPWGNVHPEVGCRHYIDLLLLGLRDIEVRVIQIGGGFVGFQIPKIEPFVLLRLVLCLTQRTIAAR
jgi:hypothetical protein